MTVIENPMYSNIFKYNSIKIADIKTLSSINCYYLTYFPQLILSTTNTNLFYRIPKEKQETVTSPNILKIVSFSKDQLSTIIII